MRCVAKNMGKVIIVSYVIDNMWSFAYYEEGIEPDNHLLNDILPSFNIVYAMEPSVRNDVFFCAGSTGQNAEGRSEGVLAALSFDRGMTLITEKILDQYNIQGCTALRRFPNSDEFVVGCFKHMLVVSWIGGNFIVNNIVEDVHSGKFIIF